MMKLHFSEDSDLISTKNKTKKMINPNIVMFKNWFINHIDPIIIGILSFLLPVKGMVFAVGFLIFADTFTGMYAAAKRKEKITSTRMSDIIPKSIGYLIFIIAAFVMQYITGDTIPLMSIASGIVGSIEFYSIVENVSSITKTDLVARIKEVFKRKNIDI